MNFFFQYLLTLDIFFITFFLHKYLYGYILIIKYITTTLTNFVVILLLFFF